MNKCATRFHSRSNEESIVLICNRCSVLKSGIGLLDWTMSVGRCCCSAKHGIGQFSQWNCIGISLVVFRY